MRVKCIGLIISYVILFSLKSTAIVWEFHGNNDGWYPGNEYVQDFQVSGDLLSFHITGGDPSILSPNNLKIDGPNFHFLHAEIEFNSNITGNAQIYFITEEDNNWNEDKVIYFQAVPGRHTYLINIPQKMLYPNKWLGQNY